LLPPVHRLSIVGRRRLSPPRGAGWEPANTFCPRVFAELRRVNTRQHCPLVRAADGKGLGYPTTHPQATREYFKNHPTHDCEIDPTIGGHLSRGIGHPWGALGLLCRKEDIAGPGKATSDASERERRDPARLNPRRERRGTLVSRRDNTVLLGCSGYRKDTSGGTPARHGRPC
jgi:hypothetical protein